jgi:hypothetical protein
VVCVDRSEDCAVAYRIVFPIGFIEATEKKSPFEYTMNQRQDPFAMSENQVIKKVCRWLPKHGYSIINHCLGHKRGIDIVAVDRNSKRMFYIEAKGNRKSKPTEKLFTDDQISKHYAVQLTQICKAMEEYGRKAIFGIASPDVPRIKKQSSSPELR